MCLCAPRTHYQTLMHNADQRLMKIARSTPVNQPNPLGPQVFFTFPGFLPNVRTSYTCFPGLTKRQGTALRCVPIFKVQYRSLIRCDRPNVPPQRLWIASTQLKFGRMQPQSPCQDKLILFQKQGLGLGALYTFGNACTLVQAHQQQHN